MMRSILVVAGVVVAAGVSAQPVDLAPDVRASILDSNLDGVGDVLSIGSGLVRAREVRGDEDRAIQEYDVSAFAGMTVVSARFVGRVSVNNSFDTGVRSFNFNIYAGNGTAELADFSENSNIVGTGAYQPPADSSFDFDFDVTAAVQAVLDGGGSWVGVNVDPIEDNNFPNILNSDPEVTSLFIEAMPAGDDCACDVNNDTLCGGSDFFAWVNAFGAQAPESDVNGDTLCNGSDFFAWVNAFGVGC